MIERREDKERWCSSSRSLLYCSEWNMGKGRREDGRKGNEDVCVCLAPGFRFGRGVVGVS